MALDLERSLDWDELDDFVQSAKGATFYHSSTWLRSLAQVYGLSLGWLTLREGGNLLGLLPFAESKRWGLIHRQSLPFGTYGGPVLSPQASVRARASLLEAFWRDLGGRLQQLTLVAGPRLEAENSEPPTTTATITATAGSAPGAAPQGRAHRTQILDLRPGWEALFAATIRKERRRQIRKALRAGVEVLRSDEAADLAAYYPIYLEHVRDWGLQSPTPLEHLRFLLRDRERVRFWVARHEGKIIGGHFNFHFRGAVTAWNGTASKAHRQLSPSVLLYAVNLEQACAEGEAFFNFGGSEGMDPLFQFKAAFGARPVEYHSLRRQGGLVRRLAGWRRTGAGDEHGQ